MRLLAEHGFQTGFAGEHRRGHAVHVAGRRGQWRVEIRMGVEPQNEQLASRLGRMAGDAADGPHRQTVIAAEHDWRPPGADDRVSLARQQSGPGGDVGEPMRLAFGRSRVDQRMGRSEIAPVLNVVTEVPQRFHNARRAQHGRSHRRAGHARARVDRRAEDGDRLSARLTPLPRRISPAACLPAQDLPPP